MSKTPFPLLYLPNPCPHLEINSEEVLKKLAEQLLISDVKKELKMRTYGTKD